MKETKELAIGLIALAGLMAERFKDGVQVEDAALIFAKLQTDEEFKAKMVAAYNGFELIKEETKEVTIAEAGELIIALIPELLKLVAVIQAPKVQPVAEAQA